MEESARLSADAAAFLLENQKGLRMHRIMLTFKSSGGTLEDYSHKLKPFGSHSEFQKNLLKVLVFRNRPTSTSRESGLLNWGADICIDAIFRGAQHTSLILIVHMTWWRSMNPLTHQVSRGQTAECLPSTRSQILRMCGAQCDTISLTWHS